MKMVNKKKIIKNKRRIINIDDYKSFEKTKKIRFTNNQIPKYTTDFISGWECLICEYKWESCYNYIQHLKKCPKCAGNLPKTMEDYQNIGKDRNISFTGSKIPQKTNIETKEWKCNICNDVFKASYNSIRIGLKCRKCHKCSHKGSITIENYNAFEKIRKIKFIKDDIPKSSHTSIENGWECLKCNNIWKASYHDIQQGKGCPKCGGTMPKTLEDFQQVGKRKNISFIGTRRYSVDESIKLWKCDICNYLIKTTYSNIRRGSGCPKCAGLCKKTMDDYMKFENDRKIKYILKEIPQNAGTPVRGWECLICNDTWRASYDSINQGSGCPNCPRKSEKLCREIIEGFLLEPFYNARPDWLKYKKGCNLELDGYNEELGIAFEYQGIQHYKHIEYFQTKEEFEYQLEKDKWKREQCKKQGVFLLEIPYIYSYQNPEKLRDFIYDYLLYRNPFGGILARYLGAMQYHIGRLKELFNPNYEHI